MSLGTSVVLCPASRLANSYFVLWNSQQTCRAEPCQPNRVVTIPTATQDQGGSIEKEDPFKKLLDANKDCGDRGSCLRV